MKPSVGTMSQTIRILLVDDHTIIREGLRLLLESQRGLSVVAEASNCSEAIEAARQSQPDVVLLDLDLGEFKGQDCLTELLQVAPETKVLILTGTPDINLHHEAISRGAMGLVRKLEAAEVLLKAIKKIFAGEVWLDGVLMARLLTELWQSRNSQSADESKNYENTPSHPKHKSVKTFGTYVYEPPTEEVIKITQLTDREREVISLVGEGLRNQQIADRLFISVITVRHHLSSIFSKLDVEDRFELAIYAYRYGLAQLPM